MKFYLDKNKSCFSNNVEGVVNTTLSTKNRLLPNNDVSTYFSLLGQYNKERDKCKGFRLIFNINPICTNVLFNMKSEIVLNEGSDNAKCLFMDEVWKKDIVAPNAINSKEEISYLDAIRNTEYSHPKIGNFVYHCGLDIFNNHMLRSNGFVHVNKTKEKTEIYNTIEDYARDNSGEIVKQYINPTEETQITDMHLYRFDNILSFKKAFSERCEEKDGWWGFINPGKINIPNRDIKNELGDDIVINQMLAGNKPCEFIDLYPDRSLFSFNPKYNKHRHRIEKNWDYCITYPSRNDYNLIDKICVGSYSGVTYNGGTHSSVKAICERTFNSNGVEIVECSSYFNHNLKVGDYITIFYIDELGFHSFNRKIKVARIGDLAGENEEKIFSINYSDVETIYNHFTNMENSLYYKKNVSGVDCLYYARIFTKLKNSDGKDLNSDINKVAFGKNIYGDENSQIIFTDDINIEGMIDNNGRPLSEVNLTIVKRNAGYDKWYSGDLTNKNIEFSHCFGKVTSGIDYSGMKIEPDLYNIHKMHNAFTDKDNPAITNTKLVWGETIKKIIPTLEEDGITISKEEFLGDIVEYDLTTATETIISPIYHRFNTYQRESFDDRFRDLLQDEIVADDYDGAIGTKVETSNKIYNDINEFTVHTYWVNDIRTGNNQYIDTSSGLSNIENLMYGNIAPEGYYYNPHYKIRLIEEDFEPSFSNAKLVNYNINSFEFYKSVNEANFDVPTNFGFYKGDYIAFYEEEGCNTIWGEIIKVSGNNITLRFNTDKSLSKESFVNKGKRIMRAYWSTNNVPTFAKLDIKNRQFVWRKLVPQSELAINYDLYNTPFANGRLYIEKNINFFLRRQDPTGKYGLSTPIYKGEVYYNPLKRFIIKGYNPTERIRDIYITKNYDNCY